MNLCLKNNTIGLPINEITAATAIYTITACILYKKKMSNVIANRTPSALKIPLAIILEFMYWCLVKDAKIKLASQI